MITSPLYNPRIRSKGVGVVLFGLLYITFPVVAQTPQDLPAAPIPAQCISGFESQEAGSSASDDSAGNTLDFQLNPEIRRWMTSQRWQAGYALWQRARRCQSGFGAPDIEACGSLTPAHASEDMCQGPQDGFEFLAMHRHLLQSQRALWPNRSGQFAGWRTFPTRDDYPTAVQNQLNPWPKAVIRAAEAVDRLRKTPRDQILARWPTEGAFGQWIQCGTTNSGLAVDSLYGALLSAGGGDYGSVTAELDQAAFWMAHGWIDRAWDAYRKALDKTPDEPQLQAELIKQCRIHSLWVEQSARTRERTQAPLAAEIPLFANGELNTQYTGTLATVLGEVDSIITGPNGKLFIKLNLRLVGVKPIWFSSYPSITSTIKPGDRYRVIGTIHRIASLDPSGHLAARLRTTSLLLATSIQTVQ